MREFIPINPKAAGRCLPALVAALLLAACGGGDSTPTLEARTTHSTQAATPQLTTRASSRDMLQSKALLIVYARADLANGVGAEMEVRVNNQLLGRTTVNSTSPQPYRFDAQLNAGSRIDITFTNDGTVNGQDRNLHVLYVGDGKRFLPVTPANSRLDRGTGARAFDGVDVIDGQSKVLWNGTLRLQWPDAATITAAQQQAARLLEQATFGPTAAEINRAAAMGASAWVSDQLAKPAQDVFVPHLQARFALGANWRPDGSAYSSQWTAQRYWAAAATSPDQLRRRMAFALHHILMVSLTDNAFDLQPRAYAKYLDTLNRHAFGNYRDLLEAIALSPAMGLYLSHIRNLPEDDATGRQPDENFARELMQLMSIGLVELNIDGSPRLDASGSSIETYTNDDVMAMAKVFTGWSWAFPDNELTAHTFRSKSPGLAAGSDAGVDLLPMKPYPGLHSSAPKVLFAGKPWGVNIPAGTGARESLRLALDAVFNHPSAGPFIGRQLIQHLVTSHPSPAYVARVAAAFNDNGRGVRGDLAAVVRTILLDAEARTPPHTDVGKLREPVLRLTHWMRAFDARSTGGDYVNLNEAQRLQQRLLHAPSVFGYFRPGYAMSVGDPAQTSLTLPEFQLVNEATVIHWFNVAQYMVTHGLGGSGGVRDVTSTYAALTPLATRGDFEGLTEQLNLLLFAGQMPPSVKADIAEAMTGVLGNTAASHLFRVQAAVLVAMTAPEYLMQR